MKHMNNRYAITRRFILSLACLSILSIAAPALSQPACTGVPTANVSHLLTHNTEYGGHVTAHVYGATPPHNMTQAGRTLFRDEQDYEEAWQTLAAQYPPLYCSANPQLGAEAARDVPIQFFSYRCRAANGNGECTQTTTFQSNSARFIFRAVDRGGRIQWILYTAYPTAQ